MHIPADPDAEMLALVGQALVRASAGTPVPIQRRIIKDGIFQTIEWVERSAAKKIGDRPIIIGTSVQHDEHRVDQEHISIPAAAVIAVIAGSRVAERWHRMQAHERAAYREQITGELLAELMGKNFHEGELRKSPLWDKALREFVDDFLDGQEEGAQTLINGLPPHILQSNGEFTVEVDGDREKQVGIIIDGTLRRLHKLCGADRKAVRDEIAGWEQWKNRLVVPHRADIPQLEKIYNDVRIPYEWFADLLSRQSEVREAALDRIRKYGGFIHAPNPGDFQEMIDYGAARMTMDGNAYYGVLADHDVVRAHLEQMCGFEPGKQYHSIEDLPQAAKNGWALEWNADPAYALSMFQSPHNVALSVEVAVMRDKPSSGQQANGGRGRRNAGIAAALKDDVYRDPIVDHAWVLTRHFQLVKVGIPEMHRPAEAVSGAVNVGSDVFIRMLGGREIGSAKEETRIMVPDKKGVEHPVELTIRWIFCLAPRKTSLDAIEGRGQRM